MFSLQDRKLAIQLGEIVAGLAPKCPRTPGPVLRTNQTKTQFG